MEALLNRIPEILRVPSLFMVIIFISTLIHYLLYGIFSRLRIESDRQIGEILNNQTRSAGRWVIIFFMFSVSITVFNQSPLFYQILAKALPPLLILSVSWLLVKTTSVVEHLILNQYKIDEKDNLKARRVYTQIIFLKKVIIIAIGVFAIGTILMTFDQVKQLGTSILASAGIMGIIVGFAAQSSIRTLFAGLQIAFTQPIRLDDVVIVENEWGRVEEITLTYVVVRIWDMRRLVLPITYFIEKPFQNWTRVSADLLGTVYLYTDYTTNVQNIREELMRIVSQEESWDRQVCELQVTNSTERTMELRALVSAKDSSKAWQLRCSVREKLIDYLQKMYPDNLPRYRAKIDTELQSVK